MSYCLTLHLVLSTVRSYVRALEFDVQAEIREAREYDPQSMFAGSGVGLHEPDFAQLVDGAKSAARAGVSNRIGTADGLHKDAGVTNDFDFVVLAIGLGEVPYVCREIIGRDQRWEDMVTHCKTVATPAFQIWVKEDIEEFSSFTQTTLSGFVQPFDTWADMRQVLTEESWPELPRGVAYFCSAIPDRLPPIVNILLTHRIAAMW